MDIEYKTLSLRVVNKLLDLTKKGKLKWELIKDENLDDSLFYIFAENLTKSGNIILSDAVYTWINDGYFFVFRTIPISCINASHLNDEHWIRNFICQTTADIDNAADNSTYFLAAQSRTDFIPEILEDSASEEVQPKLFALIELAFQSVFSTNEFIYAFLDSNYD